MSRVPERPSRPALPPALWCLVATLAAERGVLGAAKHAEPLLLTRVAQAAAVCAAVCAVVLLLRVRRGAGAPLVPVMLLVVAASASVAAACGLAQRRELDACMTHAASGWVFEALGDASPGTHGYRCRARARLAGDPRCRAQVWLVLPEPVLAGTRLRCVGRFRPLADDDFGRAGWVQGISGQVSVMRVTQRGEVGGLRGAIFRLRRHVLGRIGPERSAVRAVMAGCVCGYRVALDEQGLTDAFARCGLAHLIAVSGAHLSLLCSLLAQLLGALDLRPAVRVGILALSSGLFVIFCGAPVSAVRAWAMALVGFGAQLAGRRSHGPSSVAVVGLVMALADPTVAGRLGFLLSVTSVSALGLFGPYASYAMRCLLPRTGASWRLGRRVRTVLRALGDGVAATLAATLVCQLATLPLVADAFGRISLVAPLANLVLGIPVSLLTTMGLVTALASPLGASWVLPAAADVAEGPLVGALDALGSLPGASHACAVDPRLLGAALVLGAAGLLVWWPRVSRRVVGRVLAALALAGLALAARWWVFAPARIVVLDIGQGDAILLQDGPHAVLVDTGPDAAVAAALARNHVLRLDAVVITHLHDDHYGGLDDLVGALPCGEVLVARGVAQAMDDQLAATCRRLSGTSARELSYGDVMRVGNFRLRMVWPTVAVDGDVNAESIELVVDYRRGAASLTALLTGDAERDETGACVRAGDVGDIDLLKVGHHGSEVSLDEETAAALAPEVAVASAGAGNSYGHPSPACVAMLRACGARFLCTKDVGDVDVRPAPGAVEVRCGRDR